ncbi:hypothetical protein K438DRAFT_1857334, partial [Mycena galopus ATCC 62051]
RHLSVRARHSACVSTPLASFFSFQIVPPTRARGERRGIERDRAPFSESATLHARGTLPPHPDLRNLGMRPRLHPNALVSPLTMNASDAQPRRTRNPKAGKESVSMYAPTLYRSFIPLPHCFDSSGRSYTATRDDIPPATKPVSVNWAEKTKQN